MKQNIKAVINAVDLTLNKIQPSTMDEFINVVHNIPGIGNYGTHFTIVRYKGYLQGVRVYITGRSKSHQLPGKNKVYSVFNGVEKYEKAGWQIEYN